MSGNPEPEPAGQDAISLDELARAFAQVMGTAPKLRPPEPAAPPGGGSGTAGPAAWPRASRQRRWRRRAKKTPAPSDRAASWKRCSSWAIRTASRCRPPGPPSGCGTWRPAEIPGLVDELNRRYSATGCPYHVVHEGGGYRLTLRKEFHHLRNRFLGGFARPGCRRRPSTCWPSWPISSR